MKIEKSVILNDKNNSCPDCEMIKALILSMLHKLPEDKRKEAEQVIDILEGK